jgi:membrane-anchored mycosin MYCP
MSDHIPDLPAESTPDELVVDSVYLAPVVGILQNLGIAAAEHAADERLGLTLLTLKEAGSGPPRPVADLDAVVYELRWTLAGKCGGWTPPIGKNRELGQVVAGYPQPRSMLAVVGGFPQPQSMLAGTDPVPATSGPPVNPSPDAGQGVRVGILDTKLYPHPDLAGRYIAEDPDAVLDLPAATPIPFRAGHSAFVASLILARAPGAELHVRWALDENTGRATIWDTVQKMAKFADDGVDILNLSLGSRTADGRPPLVVSRAIERLSPRMLVVAAAGNHGALAGMVNGITAHSATWPAALADVVAVGAHDTASAFPGFTPDLPWIAVTAPGVDVVGAYLNGTVELPTGGQGQFHGYATWSGTSFATAAVSGAIAAMTVPGKVTPREALQQLLNDANGEVRKHTWTP